MNVKPEKLICLIFTLVGSVFLIIGILMVVGKSRQAQSQIQVDAVITDISSHRRSGKNHHQIVVEYEVNGKHYTRILGYYRTGMREGDTIQIRVNPDYPMQVSVGGTILELIFIGMGGLFVVLGLSIRALLRKVQKPEKESPYLL